MLVDTASSWSYLDSYDASGPDRSINYYLLSEERDASLGCAGAETVTIGNGRGRGISGPACQDYMSPLGQPQMTAKLPIVLRRNQQGDSALAGGLLGLGPIDYDGAQFVNYLFDQEKIDRNMFTILPGKNPKITFGGYQEEGTSKPGQLFYQEYMHQIVALSITGSGGGWSLPIRNVNIGENDFTPRARNVQLDVGSGVVIFGKEDYKIIADNICDRVNSMRGNMSCIGRSDDADSYEPLLLVNATRDQI